MAGLALAAYVLFFLVGFVWRAWLQRRRTGDSGLRGLSGARMEWAAVALSYAGVTACVLAPVAEMAGVLAPLSLLPRHLLGAAGAPLFVLGFVLTVVAQHQMGHSWRLGTDLREITGLVTHGLFRQVRNPIFAGLVVAFAGLSLIVPSLLSLLGLASLVAGVEIQVRCVEEPYLLRGHGDRYRDYARTAGRFVPRVGRLCRLPDSHPNR